MITLSIITPVWNQAHLTASFLNSHHHYYGDRDDLEFIIIDNGSSDATPFLLDTWRKKGFCKVITNEENRGFAAACNQGTFIADGAYFLFLNNDIILQDDYISILLDNLTGNRKTITGAAYLAFDTGWNKFDDITLPYIAGWCLAVESQDFYKLGGFDERYFPGDYEDIDFCLNAMQNGYTLRQVDLPIIHISGQTAEKQLDRNKVTLENQKRFMEKWSFKNVG